MRTPAKPTPAEWAVHCISCGRMVGRYPASDKWGEWQNTPECPREECAGIEYGITDDISGALWGREWAAVAWMAAAEHLGWSWQDERAKESRDGGWSPSPEVWRRWIEGELG